MPAQDEPSNAAVFARHPIHGCELGAVGDGVSSREGDEADRSGIYFSLLHIVHRGELSVTYVTV